MRAHDRETREKRERKRLLRVASRMEVLKDNAEIKASGDPFALELGAKLTQVNERTIRWGNLNGFKAGMAKKRLRNGFKLPKAWEKDEMKGMAVLEKALLFMSTFRRGGLGFRSLHIMMMLTGDDRISIQEAADMVGLTYYAIRHDLIKLEKEGFLTITRVPRPGGQHALLVPELTKRGAAVMRALNRFDHEKLGSYDRLVAMGKTVIPTDARLLQMKEIIDEAKNIPLDD